MKDLFVFMLVIIWAAISFILLICEASEFSVLIASKVIGILSFYCCFIFFTKFFNIKK